MLFIFYPLALPVFSIFIVTVLLDLYLNNLAASQTFAVIISLLIVKRLLTFPEQRDFVEYGRDLFWLWGLWRLFKSSHLW